jgi:hypothetical protein
MIWDLSRIQDTKVRSPWRHSPRRFPSGRVPDSPEMPPWSTCGKDVDELCLSGWPHRLGPATPALARHTASLRDLQGRCAAIRARAANSSLHLHLHRCTYTSTVLLSLFYTPWLLTNTVQRHLKSQLPLSCCRRPCLHPPQQAAPPSCCLCTGATPPRSRTSRGAHMTTGSSPPWPRTTSCRCALMGRVGVVSALRPPVGP